jgi:FixJ family two-component response regulator
MRTSPVVAIIDDDASMRDGLETRLRSHGYGVESYDSAEDFIEQVAASEAACLIVDINLKDLAGIEMGRHLEAIGFVFPIIFITGDNSPLTYKQALDFGCVACLYKPIDKPRLLSALVEAVRPGKASNC